VTCFGQSAEFALRFLRKGAQVAVRGDVHLNEWEKDGQKRSGLDVMADRVEAVGPKQEGASAPQQRPAPAPSVDWTSEETEDPFGDQ
jgi:single-strand DNA-binding protein